MSDTKGDAEVCIFIANLASWLNTNYSKDNPDHRNFHEGRYWSYNSYPEFSKYFGFWSAKVVRTIISRALKLGLIMIGNFNKKKYDNTNWYTLSDKALDYYPVLKGKLLNTPAQTVSTPAQMGRPIPEDLNSLRSNINITTSESCDSPAAATKVSKKNNLELMWGMIAAYRETFPDNPQPHPRVISTTLQKTLQTLIKRWPELDPEGKPITVESFSRYLRLLYDTAPKFSRGEYVTESGNKKKNNLETFARWNTIVKFLENSYS